MTPSLMLENIVPWLVQVCVLSLTGTALPIVFGIRHPRTQLVYGYALLLVCVALPILQPWNHPPPRPMVVDGAALHADAHAAVREQPSRGTAGAWVVDRGRHESGAHGSPAPNRSDAPARGGRSWLAGLPWPDVSVNVMLLWMLLGGATVHMVRLLAGLLQVRRYRMAAIPLFPVPAPIEEATALVGVRAAVCLSAHVSSPATIGLLRPVILLPASFLELEESVQRAVVCHELLHVRRRDSVAAMAESLVGAMLWFPPVSWLIAEIRLAREQVIDAQVVRLTSARDPYIQALLEVSQVFSRHEPLPVPQFLRRHHLTQRVHALLDEGLDSTRRVWVCYVSAVAIASAGTWLAIAAFPLVGPPSRLHAAGIDLAAVAREHERATPLPEEETATLAAAAPSRGASASPAAAPIPAKWEDPIVGPIETASSPAARALALGLLERARQNNDLHIAGTPSFHLEASFEAFGDVPHVGVGTLTQTWMSADRWRWTATLGSYSHVRLGSGNVGYDEVPVDSVPVRVQALRTAIFWPVALPQNVRLRMAAGRIPSTEATCVLLGQHESPVGSARSWNEEEYCIDSGGLLRVHSPAVGVYSHFEYSPPIRFGGRVIPSRIRTFVGGHQVLVARIGIADAGTPDEGLFVPTDEMVARGLSIPLRRGRTQRIGLPGVESGRAEPDAVIHAVVDTGGRVLEAEVANDYSSHAESALDLVRRHQFPSTGAQRELYIGVDLDIATSATR